MKRIKAVMKKQVFPAINGESSVSEPLQQLLRLLTGDTVNHKIQNIKPTKEGHQRSKK